MTEASIKAATYEDARKVANVRDGHPLASASITLQ
jgi:hypothetical protein